jgi:hypothetical protein
MGHGTARSIFANVNAKHNEGKEDSCLVQMRLSQQFSMQRE